MRRLPGAVGDVVVVVVWFAVLAVLGGLAWWRLAPDVEATTTQAGVVLQGPQLERLVGIDGWYAVIGVVGCLLSGVALSWWRRDRPVLVVALVTVCAGVAGYAAYHLGLALGPPDAQGVLQGAPDGTTAPVSLRIDAVGTLWLWPGAAVLGALAYLVVRGPEVRDPQLRSETAASEIPAR